MEEELVPPFLLSIFHYLFSFTSQDGSLGENHLSFGCMPKMFFRCMHKNKFIVETFVVSVTCFVLVLGLLI